MKSGFADRGCDGNTRVRGEGGMGNRSRKEEEEEEGYGEGRWMKSKREGRRRGNNRLLLRMSKENNVTAGQVK